METRRRASMENRRRSKFCEICGVSYKGNWRRHTISINHVAKVTPKSTRLFVSGFPRRTTEQQLRQCFSIYGPIFFAILKETSAVIDFSSEQATHDVLSAKHVLGKKKLFIKKFHVFKSNAKAKESVDVDTVISRLKECENVTHQIRTLCDMISLTKEDFERRTEVCNIVVEVLQEFYPECQVHLFGSSINGFGTKGCDIDILFEPSPHYFSCQQAFEVDRDSSKKSTAVTVSDFRLGLVTMQELIDLPPFDQLQFVCDVWRKASNMFKRPIFINARCPIVKCMDKQHLYECDISCSNRLVIYNTKLLHLFGQLDGRVKPLMMTLRYWAKVNQLIRMSFLSSYAFSLLVIFYLQKVRLPVLPPVTHLKKFPSPEKSAAGWDCSFCTDIELIGHSANMSTVEELLLGFFQFYSVFDFKFVVSTLYGQALDRSDFDSLDQLDDRNFANSPICIQDPFECSRNVTAFLKVSVLLLLKELTSKTFHDLQDLLNAKSNKPNWGILSLFSNSKIEKQCSIIPMEFYLGIPEHSVSLTLLICERLKSCLSNWRHNNGSFIYKFITTLSRIFEEVLHIDTEIVDCTDKFPVVRAKCIHGNGSNNDDVKSDKVIDAKNNELVDMDIDLTRVKKEEHLTEDVKLNISNMPSESTQSMPVHDNQASGVPKVESFKKIDRVSCSTCAIDSKFTFTIEESVLKPKVEDTPISGQFSKPEVLVSMQNTVFYNVWVRRNKFKEGLSNETSSVFDFESRVTERMVAQSPLVNPFYFTCEVLWYSKRKHDRVVLVFTPLDEDKNFVYFMSFVKSLILDLLNEALM